MEHSINRALQHAANRDRSELGEEPMPWTSDCEGSSEYDQMIASAVRLARRKGYDSFMRGIVDQNPHRSQTRELTLNLLRDSFPPWFPRAFGSFLRLFPLWFDARHAAVDYKSPLHPGESRVVDADPNLLDPVQEGQGKWGNDPVGWVPGFLLGGNWRQESTRTNQLCLGLLQCLQGSDSVRKVAIWNASNDKFTAFVFGATPPPIEKDEAFQHPCMKLCSLNIHGRSEEVI
eukprot:767263-Hanusia_phi.AAC.2